MHLQTKTLRTRQYIDKEIMKISWLFWIVSSVFYAAVFGTADAVVSGWTTPPSSGAADVSTNHSTYEGSTITLFYFACDTTGTAKYMIVEQPPSARLEIDETNGYLNPLSGKTLDFETEPIYILKVTCTDDYDNDVGTATVTFLVQDVDDAPTFSADQFAATIPDKATEGTILTTVTATDQDGDALIYTIFLGNTNGDFNISSDGVISVAPNKTLDQSTTGGYELVLGVIEDNPNHYSGSTTVWVAVTTCGSGASVVEVKVKVMTLTVAAALVLYFYA